MGSAPQLNPAQLNAMQRAAVLANAVQMKQSIFSTTIPLPGNSANVLNIPARNVGLIKKFIVEVSGQAVNTDGANASLVSQIGLANVLSNISFIDLNNNLRINTPGFHLAALAMAKRRRPAQQTLSTVVADTNQMLQVGENFPVLTYVPPAKGATQAFRAVFEVPLAYSDDDLRGAVYANVVNATMNLQLTINPNAMVAAGVDSTFALFGNAAGHLANVTVNVYQVYLDQLPVGKNGVILPILDLSTVYELKQTNFTGITVNQDFPIPYSNFRDFLSTLAVYNSTGADGGLSNGADVNTWALQSANFTNLWKVDPLEIARDDRNEIQVDFTEGMYYFASRRKPISTTQYGNMELVLNPSVATAGAAYCLICWEDFALVNTLTQAGSLAG
jgi:hypothetical protein